VTLSIVAVHFPGNENRVASVSRSARVDRATDDEREGAP
jgi:hypothetical protein